MNSCIVRNSFASDDDASHLSPVASIRRIFSQPQPAFHDQIIFMGDLNLDCRLATNRDRWMEAVGMREAMIEKHGEDPPPTYIDGSAYIDVCFVSRGLDVHKAAILSGSTGPGGKDHRTLVLDFTYQSVFGNVLPPVVTPPARRCKTKDPRVARRFASLRDKHATAHRLPERAVALETEVARGLTPRLVREAETVDRLVQEGVRYADKKCRKLRMGAKPSSPTLSFAKNMLRLCRLGLWTSSKCHRCGATETVGHVARCTRRSDIWDKWYERLDRVVRSQPSRHVFISICPIFESI